MMTVIIIIIIIIIPDGTTTTICQPIEHLSIPQQGIAQAIQVRLLSDDISLDVQHTTVQPQLML